MGSQEGFAAACAFLEQRSAGVAGGVLARAHLELAERAKRASSLEQAARRVLRVMVNHGGSTRNQLKIDENQLNIDEHRQESNDIEWKSGEVPYAPSGEGSAACSAGFALFHELQKRWRSGWTSVAPWMSWATWNSVRSSGFHWFPMVLE